MNENSGPGIERGFFAITRYCIMAVTALALPAALIGGAVGYYKYQKTSDSSITMPSVDYEELKRGKQRAKQEEEDRREAEKKPSPAPPQGAVGTRAADAIPAPYLERLMKIEIALKIWAQATGQTEPANNARVNIYKRAAGFKEYFSIADTLKILEAECEKLKQDAERMGLLTPDDLEYFTWGEFLDFFFEEIEKGRQRQLTAIARQKALCAEENARGALMLSIAGASFGVFILFTLLLAILRVERNSDNICKILHASRQVIPQQAQGDA